jgi:hypothetical protein
MNEAFATYGVEAIVGNPLAWQARAIYLNPI